MLKVSGEALQGGFVAGTDPKVAPPTSIPSFSDCPLEKLLQNARVHILELCIFAISVFTSLSNFQIQHTLPGYPGHPWCSQSFG